MESKNFSCFFFFISDFLFFYHAEIYIYICIREVRYNSLFVLWLHFEPQLQRLPYSEVKKLPTFCPSICMVSFCIFKYFDLWGCILLCRVRIQSTSCLFFPVLLNDQSLFPLMSHFILNSHVYLSSSLGFFSSSSAPFSFIY